MFILFCLKEWMDVLCEEWELVDNLGCVFMVRKGRMIENIILVWMAWALLWIYIGSKMDEGDMLSLIHI